MKEKIKKVLAELTSISGASGFEDDVARYVFNKIKKNADNVEIDSFGNITAFKEGVSDKPSIMLAAHMDEIGFIVKKVETNGFLRITTLGYPNPIIMAGRNVKINGKYNGVIGARNWHTTPPEQRNSLPSLNDLFVDVGAKSDQEVMQMGIKVGSPISFVNELTQLGESERYAAKALDDRLGCLIILLLFEALSSVKLQIPVYGVFTVQEEIGLRGAYMTVNKINPNFAIALDGVLAEDTPDQTAVSETSVQLGKGPAVNVKEMVPEGFMGMIGHPRFVEHITKVAEKNKIPCQLAMLIGGVSDAHAIHLSGGIPSVYMGTPFRNAHSPVETIDLNDLELTLQLVIEIVKSITPETSFRMI